IARERTFPRPSASRSCSDRGCGGPQPLAGKQVDGVSFRDPSLGPVFGHGRVFAAISNRFRAARLQEYRRDSNTQENGPDAPTATASAPLEFRVRMLL